MKRTRTKTFFIALALAFLCYASLAHAAILWSDDFETGSLAQWTVTGTWQANTTSPIFGSWSARPGTGDQGVMRKEFYNNTLNTTRLAFWIKKPTTASYNVFVGFDQATVGNPSASAGSRNFYIQYAGTDGQFTCNGDNGTAGFSYNIFNGSILTNYSVVLSIFKNNNTGGCEIYYQNGTLAASRGAIILNSTVNNTQVRAVVSVGVLNEFRLDNFEVSNNVTPSNAILQISNVVNNTLLSNFCVILQNATNTTICTSSNTLSLSTSQYVTNQLYNLSFVNITDGGASPKYFNTTVQNINLTTVNILVANTTQGLLNLSAFQLYTNTSIANFNATNGGAFNTTSAGTLLLGANNGSNTISISVPGNYTQSITCTILSPLSIAPCNATGFYDDLYTISVNDTLGTPISGYTILVRNSTLGGLLYNQTSPLSSINLSLLQGYLYQINITKTGYNPTSALLAGNATQQNKTLQLAPFALRITFLDEINRSIIGQNISLAVIFANGSQSLYTTLVSQINITGQLDPGNYTFRYGALGYSYRDYYYTLAQPDNNITLYLISATTYSPGTVEVIDYDGTFLAGAIVQMTRYYGDPTIPSIVQYATTGSQGGAVMVAESVTGYYLWNVTVNGINRYSSTVPEQLVLTADGLWHKTFSLTAPPQDAQSEQSGVTIAFSPQSPLQNGTSYNFTVNVSSAYWNLTSCSFYLYNLSTNTTVAGPNTTFCTARGGITTLPYLPPLGDQVQARVNIYTDYFSNSYQYTYTIVNLATGNYTLAYLVNDINAFHGAGFNDFAKFLISIIAIVTITVGATRTTTFVNGSEEVLLLVFMLTLCFSYLGWMRIPLESMPNEAVRQWFIAIVVGFFTLVQGLRRTGVLG